MSGAADFGGDDELDDELSIEDQARARGWKPLEEFTGPPSRWRDAAEFLRIGDADNRILKEEVRRLTTQNSRLSNQVETMATTQAEQSAALKEAIDLARRADDRGYQRALNELKQERREAVEAGDTEAFDQIDERVRAMESERTAAPAPVATPTPTPTPTPATPAIAPEIIAFTEANPWFTTDKELNTEMLANFNATQTRYPTWPLDDLLEEARRLTAEAKPEKAEIMGVQPPAGDDEEDEAPAPAPAPRRASTVARPASHIPQRRERRGTGWETIADPKERADCQAAYARIKKSDPDYTVAEYLAVYNDPHADVLSLRRSRSAQA